MGVSRFGSRIALLLLGSLMVAAFVAGCFDMRTRVYADGRIKREVTIRVPEGREDGARVFIRDTFPRSAGWSVKEVQGSNSVEFIATSRPVDLKDDPWSGRPKPSLETEPRGQLHTSLLYTETLTDEVLFVSDAERAGFDHLTISYTVEMPGRIVDADDPDGQPPVMRPLERYRPPQADGAEDEAPTPQPSFQITQKVDGSRVTWELPMAALAPKGVRVEVMAVRLNRARASLWTIAGIVGVIILYFVIVRLLVWRRVRAERAAELRELEYEEWDEEDEDETGSGGPKWWPFGKGGASAEDEDDEGDEDEDDDGDAAADEEETEAKGRKWWPFGGSGKPEDASEEQDDATGDEPGPDDLKTDSASVIVIEEDEEPGTEASQPDIPLLGEDDEEDKKDEGDEK
ncbi:MAG: hypothetical protein GF320_11505 [Armatimonadia bacterium]|nr:hypothetical protein [Armatimonadia bacterium]